ncbi:MAG: hypothetical protein COX62_05250 [Deltaproteobacteria bacterium CG_4_10_14_0_2_um_filter_43_8]|nr:MAG: hypothetical protein COV43_02785 [Deltaproteobacteria bacterium CG11_big_fil_rev_8_21_14_0_20_42_23]PJA20128.1 MAG: hypothetical protein COX62_05250 [Deltaproteobacteria bacterium CG_4_10_14_0_2_um_filter_43_8]PJC64415.1 MAG: hypothetical protein CO021_04345 [Deltaproteobacteria bacterium CG_4_9_14_0_2_um_filter_42_21]
MAEPTQKLKTNVTVASFGCFYKTSPFPATNCDSAAAQFINATARTELESQYLSCNIKEVREANLYVAITHSLLVTCHRNEKPIQTHASVLICDYKKIADEAGEHQNEPNYLLDRCIDKYAAHVKQYAEYFIGCEPIIVYSQNASNSPVGNDLHPESVIALCTTEVK